MKIAVISSTVFPVPVAGYSGLEHLAWLQAKGLAERGHDVYLVAPDGSSCPGVKMVHTGPPGRVDERNAYGGFAYQTGRKVIQNGKEVDELAQVPAYWPLLLEVDCIISNDWQKWAYTLKQEGRLKAPILGVMHAPVPGMMSKPPPGVEKPCFVCISQDQADHFNALFSPLTAKVCHNGVDPDFYQPIEGIKRTDRFLFLARFSSIKGADLAIEACRQAGVGLDLIGDTSITQEPEYLAHCKKMADGKQIRIVGGVPRGETVWWYSQAHCMIHPNQRFREPFGLAPVEALLCGCPVIAWDYGAMRETISPKVGALVKSMEQLVDAIKNAAAPLSQSGVKFHSECREWALRFSTENMISRYEELCKEAVETGGW